MIGLHIKVNRETCRAALSNYLNTPGSVRVTNLTAFKTIVRAYVKAYGDMCLDDHCYTDTQDQVEEILEKYYDK